MRPTALAMTLALAGTAFADVETQQFEYAWSVADGNEPAALSFAAFDTMGGMRELTGVSFAIDGSFGLGLSVENLEEAAIGEGEWFVESAVLMNMEVGALALGAIDAVGFPAFSADLAGNDGVAGQGDDFVAWSYAEGVAGSIDIQPQDFGVFEGGGMISGELYPFLSLAISAPPPLFDLFVDQHEHAGAITLSYEFTVVPAPGAAAVGIACVGGLAWRRRRV